MEEGCAALASSSSAAPEAARVAKTMQGVLQKMVTWRIVPTEDLAVRAAQDLWRHAHSAARASGAGEPAEVFVSDACAAGGALCSAIAAAEDNDDRLGAIAAVTKVRPDR